ncbi:hypothetical protein ATCC90586_007692 [Pythium insidiosum]|nr:hypothetical protein ATCC90586_007692 [Pythium insidiosum]
MEQPTAHDVVELSKSPSDKKKYRLVTLDNALQVLLISASEMATTELSDCESVGHESDDDDENDDDDDDDDMSDVCSEQSAFDAEGDESEPPRRRAGACLTIGVGSFAEPENLPGLAHYLEHMLFMGSEKYPDENEFESFLSAHGGFSNGATDNEMTSYTFEVGPAHLERALDMFAQFFVAPLMKESALERELSAIESEFNQATRNDRIRVQQVLCDTAPPSHPYRRFGWGNHKSLFQNAQRDGIDVRDTILKFYQRYYSANLMKLVVCGEDSLDDMETWVRASFTAIPNKNIERPTFQHVGPPFGEGVDVNPLLCRVVPVRDIHTLHLMWMIPTVFGQHNQRPADYVASLLGHEAEGSILSELKRRGWISSLTAGVTDSDGYECGTYGAKFELSVKLTLDGISHWDEIVLVVFEYLSMLRASGLPGWIFEELQALADISYRFQEDASAVEHCEELAQIMQDMFKVAPSELLRYDLFVGDFQRDEVEKVLGFLTPQNIRVVLVSQTMGEDPIFTSTATEEKWFGVQYSATSIDPSTLSRWKDASTSANLHLPVPNPFIPRDFALIETAPKPEKEIMKVTSETGTLWYKSDEVFAMPRAYIAFLIHLPSVMGNAESLVHAELYARLVRDALNEYAYHASVAELSYSLRVKDTAGLELSFGGFHDKLALLVDVVVSKLFSNAVDSTRFNPIKEDLLRDYKNSLIKPANKSKYLRLQLLERDTFSVDAAIIALEKVTPASLDAFLRSTLWAGGVHLSTLAHGNLTLARAEEMQRIVSTGIERVNARALTSNERPARHIHVLPAGDDGLLIKAPSQHADEKNTHIEFYYQFGEHDVRTLAYADLLHQLMEEPLFDTLRTKQELGYDVSCTVRLTHGVIGFGVMVESSLFKADYITSCIENFLVEFEQAIMSMSDEHFQDHVTAQLLKKREPDHTMLEVVQRLWYEITSGRVMFDINEQLVAELEQCTKEHLLAYYREWILRQPRKLLIQVIGQASPDVVPSEKSRSVPERAPRHLQPTEITDVYSFKSSLPYFEDRFQLPASFTSSSLAGERTAL